MHDISEMPDAACPCTAWVCESLDAAGQSTRCDDALDADGEAGAP